MIKISSTFLLLTILLATLCMGAAGSDDANNAVISTARQLRLKRELMMGQSSLLATLQENRRKWSNANDDMRRQLREKALAFNQADPDNQERIIQAMERFSSLSPQQQENYRRRAQWVKQVMQGLNESQRQTISKLPPQQQAKELIKLAKTM